MVAAFLFWNLQRFLTDFPQPTTKATLMKRNELIIVSVTLSVAAILTGLLWPKPQPIPKSRAQEREEILNAELSQDVKTLSATSSFALKAPDSFWLYSLNPSYVGSEKPGTEYFHEYEILGRLEITNKSHQAAIINALYKGLDEAKGKSPACFNPRHGILATRGTNKTELLICFECGKGYEFILGQQARYFGVGYSPANIFNVPLKQADIPIAKEY